MRGLATIIALLGGMLLVAPATSAQDDALEQEARALFEAGRVAFDAGRYDDALEHFDDAYARSQRPRLLYNVGLAADRAGRVDLAIRAYTKFLESVSDSPHRGTVEQRLAELRAQEAAAQQSAEPTTTPDAPPLVMGPAPTNATTEPQPEPRQETPQQSEMQLEQLQQDQQQQTRAEQRSRPMPEPPSRTGPVLFIVGGAALAVGGLALIGLSFKAKSDAEGDTMWPRANDANEAARRRSGAGFILAPVGLVAALAGIVWLRVSERNAYSLTLGPSQIGLRGTF